MKKPGDEAELHIEGQEADPVPEHGSVGIEDAFAQAKQALAGVSGAPERADVRSGVSSAALVVGLIGSNPQITRRTLLGLAGLGAFFAPESSVASKPPGGAERLWQMNPELAKLARSMQEVLKTMEALTSRFSRYSDKEIAALNFEDFDGLSAGVEQAIADIKRALIAFAMSAQNLRLDDNITEDDVRQFHAQNTEPFERRAGEILNFVLGLKEKLLAGYAKFLGKVDDGNFDREVLARRGQSILLVSTDWCGACKHAAHLLAHYLHEAKNPIAVNRVSIQDKEGRPINERLARMIKDSKVDIEAYPTIVLYKDGVPVRFMCRSFKNAAEVEKFVKGQMEVIPRGGGAEDPDPQPNRDFKLRPDDPNWLQGPI